MQRKSKIKSETQIILTWCQNKPLHDEDSAAEGSKRKPASVYAWKYTNLLPAPAEGWCAPTAAMWESSRKRADAAFSRPSPTGRLITRFRGSGRARGPSSSTGLRTETRLRYTKPLGSETENKSWKIKPHLPKSENTRLLIANIDLHGLLWKVNINYMQNLKFLIGALKEW